MSDTPSILNPYRLQKMALEGAQRGSALHRQFLSMRQEGLRNARALIEQQLFQQRVLSAMPVPVVWEPPEQPEPPEPPEPAEKPEPAQMRLALFDSRQLDAFGTGSITGCLGPAFAKYAGRRLPRIPNGDLKMMSRIVAIEGTMGVYAPPASIIAEYDVPRDAWYFRDSLSEEIPTGLWMEIALQPCGFLSAYLDTYALAPSGEFYFRNLDGTMRLVEKMDVRGKTLSTRAWLLGSAVSGGTVIQKYGFEIACEGCSVERRVLEKHSLTKRVLYTGESTFGYFSAASMASQVGLDGGRVTAPAFRADVDLTRRTARVDVRRLQAGDLSGPGYRLAQNRLHFIEDLFIAPRDGRFGRGYAYAARPVDPGDWYYPFHFYQDPVMPGSLGVEAVLETMRGFALAAGLGRDLRSPRFGAASSTSPITWRYRGQITQQHALMELEVHISAIEQHAGQFAIFGDACLWADGLRIYEIKNAAVGIWEG